MCCNCVCRCSCEKVPDSEVQSLLDSGSFPGKEVPFAEDEDVSKRLSKSIAPSVVSLFSDTFGYAYEGSSTKPIDSPGKVSNLESFEVLEENYSAICYGDLQHVRACMYMKFTKPGKIPAIAIPTIVDAAVAASSALFAPIDLHDWKTHVFNTSIPHPSDRNVTQETRGVSRFAHIERDSEEEKGKKEKVVILYYVAATWESK